MRLRPVPFEVPSSDPFKHDVLERQPVAVALTELIRTAQDGLVLTIDSPWGSGKTTFLSMWQQHLSNEGFKTIAFNAWETDFTDDPLVALLGELEVGLQQIKNSDSSSMPPAWADHLDKARRLGATLLTLLRRAVPPAIKAATAGILDLDAIPEAAFADYAEKLASDQVKAYEASKQSIHAFRETLKELAEKVTAERDGKSGAPLVFLIDELDRCRPLYALRVLECIKHLFAVPGIVFVLAVDREQLGHAVRGQYGAGMDSAGYLRKFFDLEFTLPPADPERFCKAQFERFGLAAAFKERDSGRDDVYNAWAVEPAFCQLFKAFSCSLRDQERCFTLLSPALRTTPIDGLLIPHLLATLIVLKIKEPDLYGFTASHSADADAVLARIRSNQNAAEFIKTYAGGIVEAQLRVSMCPCGEEHTLRKFWLQEDTSGDDRAQSISNYINRPETERIFGKFDDVLKKIDLVSSFRA